MCQHSLLAEVDLMELAVAQDLDGRGLVVKRLVDLLLLGNPLCERAVILHLEEKVFGRREKEKMITNERSYERQHH